MLKWNFLFFGWDENAAAAATAETGNCCWYIFISSTTIFSFGRFECFRKKHKFAFAVSSSSSPHSRYSAVGHSVEHLWSVCLSVCLYLYCSFIYLVAVANSALSSHRTLYYLSLISSVCLRVRDISLIKAQWAKFKRPEIQTARYFSLIPFGGDWTIGLGFKMVFRSSWTAVLLRFKIKYVST